jgi:hypothetical protein
VTNAKLLLLLFNLSLSFPSFPGAHRPDLTQLNPSLPSFPIRSKKFIDYPIIIKNMMTPSSMVVYAGVYGVVMCDYMLGVQVRCTNM